MAKLLWTPSQERIQSSQMARFLAAVNQEFHLNLSNYDQLYQWSVENTQGFWGFFFKWAGVIHSQGYSQVVDDPQKMPGAKWFAGAKLNFAENLLRYRDQAIAISFKGEGQPTRHLSYAGLYDQVARLAKSLRDMGVTQGDRVAGFVPNMTETIIAMLATTSIGAIWSSCSPDFGIKGVLDRFSQIKPKVLFTADGYRYNGKCFNSLERVEGILKELPSIEQVVILPYVNQGYQPNFKAAWYPDFISPDAGLEINFAQLPADHPLYIMYSSGTTGIPKCIVHGAGGTLIQHLKELILHSNLSREDCIFYFTTCGWMMWNWLVSSLAVGARVFLYDGSTFYPQDDSLFQMVAEESITVFGTSAKYLAAAEKAKVLPKAKHDFSKLKAILSTGSTLSIESFEYVYREVKADLQLSSISGGTDIISCFALGNPMLPVYAGELQCRGLGMKVEAFNDEGQGVLEEKGELVCTKAAPSMPIGFWDDPKGEKYQAAYFGDYPGIWCHGDFVEITPRGGVIIYGRSDATLNPGGVRIGTAEIYRQVEAMDEYLDSIIIGQDWDHDVRVILFVKLAPGVTLDQALIDRTKSLIRQNTTPRHVPAKILAVPDIPYTISGKKVELAVRNLVHNRAVKNKDALANPDSLRYFTDIPELQS